MRVLNLYAGLGGNRKLWGGQHEIVAVEKNEKIAKVYSDLFPNDKLVIGDAHQYLLDNYDQFDIIWSSPPCQSHSKMMKATRHKAKKYPDLKLYEEIIFLKHFFKGNWIVENVVPYYDPLISPSNRMGRHLIWTNVTIVGSLEIKSPKDFINNTNAKGAQGLKDWLGIHYEGNIYYEGNHCPAQVLRNCVHPGLGEYLFNHLL